MAPLYYALNNFAFVVSPNFWFCGSYQMAVTQAWNMPQGNETLWLCKYATNKIHHKVNFCVKFYSMHKPISSRYPIVLDQLPFKNSGKMMNYSKLKPKIKILNNKVFSMKMSSLNLMKWMFLHLPHIIPEHSLLYVNVYNWMSSTIWKSHAYV